MHETTCCFFGHRTIHESDELRKELIATVEGLITDQGVDTFLFGSKSRFDSLCLELVTELKKKYPHIKRIYVRAEFPVITESYAEYLLQSYEETYYPEKIVGSGKAVYVERNFEMIDQSKYCIVYCDESYAPVTRKSGTRIALDYAIKKGRVIVTFPE